MREAEKGQLPGPQFRQDRTGQWFQFAAPLCFGTPCPSTLCVAAGTGNTDECTVEATKLEHDFLQNQYLQSKESQQASFNFAIPTVGCIPSALTASMPVSTACVYIYIYICTTYPIVHAVRYIYTRLMMVAHVFFDDV